MKTFAATAIALSLVVGSIAFAHAPRLTFYDAGFDYASNAQESVAYVELDRNGDGTGLRLSFSSVPGVSGLPTVTIREVPDTGRKDVFGNSVLASRDDLAEITVVAFGMEERLVTLHHEGASLLRTVDSYLRVVQELGFDVDPVLSHGSAKVFTFGDGDVQYRLVFAYSGQSVRVTLT